MASNKFDFIVNLTHSHNDVLVRVLNCSANDIVKYRKGILPVPTDPEMLQNISVFFAQKIRDEIQEKGASIFFAKGTPWPKDTDSAAKLIAKWLTDPTPVSEVEKKDFLYSIACLYAGASDISDIQEETKDSEVVPDHLKIIRSRGYKTTDQVKAVLGSDSSISYGDLNKRNTVLKILQELCQADKTYHFTIYSESGIGWFTDDPDYFSKWYVALQTLLKKGSTLSLIVNFNGDESYFAGGLKMWLNLFGTGQLQVYHGYVPSNILVYRTLFVVEDTVAFSSYSYSYESSDKSINITVRSLPEIQKLSAINLEIISNSTPLLKIYSSSDIQDFTYDMLAYRNVAGDVILASQSPALFTMPDSVITSISERCSSESWKPVAEQEKTYYKRLMHDNTVSEILNLPSIDDVMNEKVPVPFSGIFCSKPIYYKPDELLAHLKNLQRFKVRNSQYKLVISSRVISELEIDIKESTGAFLTVHNASAKYFYFDNVALTSSFFKILKKLVSAHLIKITDSSAFDKYIGDLESEIKRKIKK